MRGAATERVHGSFLTERDRAGLANRDVTYELVKIRALELALEESIELCVSRRLLAVRHTERVRLALGKLEAHRFPQARKT
jgi:hypothetical protein